MSRWVNPNSQRGCCKTPLATAWHLMPSLKPWSRRASSPMAISDIRRSKALAVVTQKAKVFDASGRPVDLEALDADLRAAEAAGEVEVIED